MTIFNSLVLKITMLLVVLTGAANSSAAVVTIESIAVDTSGSNKFIEVSPAKTECTAVGVSVLLFNQTGENASMAYSALLMAFAAGRKVDITYDGSSSYCFVQKVRVLKENI